MLVFRSEAHVTAWLAGRPAGATIPIAWLAELATAWWSDRLAPDWQPHTREQNQALLNSLNLSGECWRLG
jgi:hypothetical protein